MMTDDHGPQKQPATARQIEAQAKQLRKQIDREAIEKKLIATGIVWSWYFDRDFIEVKFKHVAGRYMHLQGISAEIPYDKLDEWLAVYEEIFRQIREDVREVQISTPVSMKNGQVLSLNGGMFCYGPFHCHQP